MTLSAPRAHLQKKTSHGIQINFRFAKIDTNLAHKNAAVHKTIPVLRNQSNCFETFGWVDKFQNVNMNIFRQVFKRDGLVLLKLSFFQILIFEQQVSILNCDRRMNFYRLKKRLTINLSDTVLASGGVMLSNDNDGSNAIKVSCRYKLFKLHG